MYQGKLYKCTTAITTSGAWDSTKWSLAILSDDVADLKSVTSDIEATLAARYYTLTIGRYNPTTKQKSGTQTDRIFSSLIPFHDFDLNYTVPTGYKAVYYLYDASETLTASYDSSWVSKISVSNPGGYIAIVWANTSFGNLTETDVAALSDAFGTRLDTIDTTIAFDRNKDNKLFPDAGTVEIGSISLSTGADEDATNRARTNMVWFRAGTRICIPDGFQATVLRYLPTGVYRVAEAYWQSGEYVVPSDGYRRLLIREPSSIALTNLVATLNKELYAYIPVDEETSDLYASVGVDHDPLVLRTGNITPATGEISTARTDRISTGFVKIQFTPCKITWGANFRGYVYEYNAAKTLIASSASALKSVEITNSSTSYIIVVFYKLTFDAFNTTDTESLFSSFKVQNAIEAARATAPALNADYNLPILTIVDDDGRTDLPTFLDMMKGKGVSMTAALITDRVGTSASLTVAQILSYKAQGFDFISHSATHSKDIFGSSVGTGNYTNFSLVSDADIINELKSSHDFLVKYGLNPECIAWPWGHYPETFQSAMNNPDPNDADVCGAENQKLRYAKIAKEVGYIYGLDSIGGMNAIGVFDNYWISREAFYADDTNYPESYYTGLLDKCKQSGGWLILMTHCSDPVYGNVTKLGNVVQYALDHGISVLNMKDAYAKKKNAVSAGMYADPNSYFVGNDGFSR